MTCRRSSVRAVSPLLVHIILPPDISRARTWRSFFVDFTERAGAAMLSIASICWCAAAGSPSAYARLFDGACHQPSNQ
jgi:hypothetical protein